MKPYYFAFFLGFSLLANAQVDLHAHLSMKPGTGLLTRGDFSHEPQSKDWTFRHATKATSASFNGFVSPLIVVSLYGHPILSFTEVSKVGFFDGQARVDRALDMEYQEILNFVNSHSAQFGFAKNAAEADALISQNKTAIVLSLEGAYGALEDEAGFKKWIDDRGVAIVTPFHLTEDHFSGVALLEGFRAVNSPFEFFNSLLITGFGCLKTFCKGTIGISERGMALLQKLMDRKVWIDAAHASDIDLLDMLTVFEKNKLPLLVTHTQLREFYHAERGLNADEIQYIKRNNGIIGLIPTQDLISKIKGTNEKCVSGLDQFKAIVAEAAHQLGPEKVALGTDINAPLNGLSPSCESTATGIAKNGFYLYSQLPELADFVAPESIGSSKWKNEMLAQFLNQWRVVRPSK